MRVHCQLSCTSIWGYLIWNWILAFLDLLYKWRSMCWRNSSKVMKNISYFPAPQSLPFTLFDSSTDSHLNDRYSKLIVEGFFFFKWKENLGKIILCMNFFCDMSWVQVADFCSRVALWPFFKHLRLSSEVHWMWWDMILKYRAFKKTF